MDAHEEFFGPRIAARYDADSAGLFDPAVVAIADVMSGGSPAPVMLPTSLVVRNSTAEPPAPDSRT